MVRAEEHFLKMLTDWLELEAKKKFPFLIRKSHLMNLAFVLMPITNSRLGLALKTIIEFERRLILILSLMEDQAIWKDLFIFTIALAQAQQLLRCFLALHHFVFPRDEITKGMSREIHEIWDRFTTGMWQFLAMDQNFCRRCAELNHAQTILFKLKKSKTRKSKSQK
jgi:hypothetical protein